MLNRIILIGRLTQDPELRYTPNGVAVCSFTLAVDRQRANQSGEREADFISIIVWQKLGELCAQYLRKGRMAAVDGRLQIRSYENKEGQRVRVAEVVAENVRFLDRGDQNNGNSESMSHQQSGNDHFSHGGLGGNNFGGNYGSGFGGSFNGGFGNQTIHIDDSDLPF